MDWARYWRAEDAPVEVMHAHFASHVYHRHSHESYSFGVTEAGAQAFACRGGRRVSGAGMVMAFNPDDPHDGHAATAGGFTYRMVHVWPGYFGSLLGTSSPLFREPVLDDPAAAAALRRVCAARRMLAAGVAPAQAAARAGFADQAHLTRWFRRVYGVTPGTYALTGSSS